MRILILLVLLVLLAVVALVISLVPLMEVTYYESEEYVTTETFYSTVVSTEEIPIDYEITDPEVSNLWWRTTSDCSLLLKNTGDEGGYFRVEFNLVTQEGEKIDIPLLKIDPRVEEDQKESLRKLRETRDNDKVKRSLEDLADAARGTANVMPRILECARSLATLGEICDVFRDVYGRWEEPKIF